MMWMAGGGIKGGTGVRKTDELGSNAIEDRFHVKNLHATVLQQLGLDPNGRAYFYGGLNWWASRGRADPADHLITVDRTATSK